MLVSIIKNTIFAVCGLMAMFSTLTFGAMLMFFTTVAMLTFVVVVTSLDLWSVMGMVFTMLVALITSLYVVSSIRYPSRDVKVNLK